MARTVVTVNTFLPDSATGLLDPAGTAIDQANGMNVALASGAFPAAPTLKNLILKVNNSAAGTHVVTVRKGVGEPYGIMRTDAFGDLNVSIATTVTRWIGPLSSSRFTQADGSINVDFDASTTGTITAFLVPERVV